MTVEELKDNLASFGPDLKTWPAALAESALDLLETSAEAQDVYAREVQEDTLLRDVIRLSRRVKD